MAIVEVSIVPVGTKGASVSKYVARALKVLKRSGLDYELTPMGTIIHGELEEVFNVVRDMHENCFFDGVMRVLTFLKIDDRRDRNVQPRDKVDSVMEQLRLMEEKGDE